MTAEYEKAVERRARAIYEEDSESGYCGGDDEDGIEWRSDEYLDAVWDSWLDIARATFVADDAAGYALVPVEATAEMVRAAMPRWFRDFDKTNVNAANAAGKIRVKP